MSDTATATGPLTKRDLVEGNIDKIMTREQSDSKSLTISDTGRNLYQTMTDVIDAAKYLAASGPLVPKWLQGNVGGCWGVISQTLDWNRGRPPERHMSPIFVARMSFEVNDQVGYMAQMFTALLNSSGLFKQRPRFRYEGEDGEMKCFLTMHFKDEETPIEHETPRVREIKKGSPLWTSDKKQQLGYYAMRSFGRLYCPEVFGGFYDEEEVAAMKDVTPRGVTARLPGATDGEGYRPDNVERGLAGSPLGDESELAEIAAEAPAVEQTVVEPPKPTSEADPRPTSSVSGTEPEPEKSAKRTRKPKTPEKAAGDQAAAEQGKPEAASVGNEPSETQNAPLAVSAPSEAPAEKPAPATIEPPKPTVTARPGQPPSNETEYRLFISAWAAKMPTWLDIENRWKVESELRQNCSIPLKVRKDIFLELRAEFDKRGK